MKEFNPNCSAFLLCMFYIRKYFINDILSLFTTSYATLCNINIVFADL